ncbi:putative dimethylmenaquinone methyltransferase [Mycobacterium kansasii 824]|nr:putative dimethylmenaquinone methyltransferase [Mycobacterium kansasii 824]
MTHQHRAHIIELRSPDPDRVLVGPAVTISFLPVRKDLMDPQKHSLGRPSTAPSPNMRPTAPSW